MVTEKKGVEEERERVGDRDRVWRQRSGVETEMECGGREGVWRQSRSIAFWLRFSHDSIYSAKRIVRTTNLSTVAKGRCNCVYQSISLLFYVSSQQGLSLIHI